MSKPRACAEGTKPVYLDKIVWAVTVDSHYIPEVKCLDQALAAHVLLSQQSYPTQLYIGVAKDKDGQLIGHALVESQGRTVIGGLEKLNRYYTVMPLTGFDTNYSLEWRDQ